MFFEIIFIFTRPEAERAEITGEYMLSLKYLQIQFQEGDERKENVGKEKLRST